MEKIKELFAELTNVLDRNKPMEDMFGKRDIELDRALLDYGKHMHPIVYHVNFVGESLIDLFTLLDEEVIKEHLDRPIPVLPVEYFPSLDTAKYFGDRQSLVSLHHANLV